MQEELISFPLPGANLVRFIANYLQGTSLLTSTAVGVRAAGAALPWGPAATASPEQLEVLPHTLSS